MATSDLLLAARPALRAVLPLGDDVYECGTAQAFADLYGPSWGRLKGITHPIPGNHEYYAAYQGVPCTPPGPAGYFGYFGSAAGDPAKGYYSYDLGQWHVVALNSGDNCSPVGCSATSAQVRWLQADLAASTRRCTLAYFHHPLFNASLSGARSYPRVRPLWQALQAAGADVVLGGHVHHYERWKPQSPDGVASAQGIREFVVGTGGRSHEAGTAAANLSSMIDDAFGVLLLTLHDDGYSWRFKATSGRVRDQGFTACH
jgi:acid phosphatase type 7